MEPCLGAGSGLISEPLHLLDGVRWVETDTELGISVSNFTLWIVRQFDCFIVYFKIKRLPTHFTIILSMGFVIHQAVFAIKQRQSRLQYHSSGKTGKVVLFPCPAHCSPESVPTQRTRASPLRCRGGRESSGLQLEAAAEFFLLLLCVRLTPSFLSGETTGTE